ncbi:flagellar biosynthetic protein FliO [Stieleria sp. TO1_6]|uniref:FliO/MopB family protein n=1 Tax=Stieleria tagensis TaxID=2956795 RepID=UPI00209B2772|nr:flagellar biosynthetic protein FliO [Stieleria tagensis]MCO8123793.1 flagellar biosynthetic protein FliO [Stieleria tagensis]
MVCCRYRLLVCLAITLVSQNWHSEQVTAQNSVVQSAYVVHADSSQPLPQTVAKPQFTETSRGEFPALVVPTEDAEIDEAGLTNEFAAPIVTTVSSLLVVLAIFGGLVWLSRRYGATTSAPGSLPEDVLKNLGSSMVDSKNRVTFLKVGQRILVIGQAANGDPQTLSEISDPDEVHRITNRCLGRPEIVGRRTSLNSSERPTSLDPHRRQLASG